MMTSTEPKIDDILNSPSMTRAEKIAQLERWAYDAREMSVAEEEGMGGGPQISLTEIDRALAKLRGDDKDNHEGGPTKQGS